MRRNLWFSITTLLFTVPIAIGRLGAQQPGMGNDTTPGAISARKSAVLLGGYYSGCSTDMLLGLEGGVLYRIKKKPRLMLGLHGSLALATIFLDPAPNAGHVVSLYTLGGR